MSKALSMKEITEKGLAWAKTELKESSTRLKSLRFQAVATDLKDVRSIRQLRRSIARLKTFISNN